MTGTDQVPSGVLGRVQVLEAGHVAAHDDEVHALGVLDVEVAHGPAAAVDDPEGELERLALRRGAAGELERQALLADGEAAHRLRRHRRRAPSAAIASMPAFSVAGLPGWTSMRLPANAAPAKTSASTAAKPASLASGVHAVTCACVVAVYSAGRRSITPAMASSIATCSMTISAPRSVMTLGRQQADRRRTSAGTSRPTSPRWPASRGRGRHPADHRRGHRRRHAEEHQRGPTSRARADRVSAQSAGRPRTAMPSEHRDDHLDVVAHEVLRGLARRHWSGIVAS